MCFVACELYVGRAVICEDSVLSPSLWSAPNTDHELCPTSTYKQIPRYGKRLRLEKNLVKEQTSLVMIII